MATNIQSALGNMVPPNYKNAPTVSLSQGAGKALGFVGKLNPLGGPLAAAGQSATATLQQGGSLPEAQRSALGAAGFDLLGGKVLKGPVTLAKSFAKPASKPVPSKKFTNLLQGGLTFDISPTANAWSATETAASYVGGTSLGLLADRRPTKGPNEPKRK